MEPSGIGRRISSALAAYREADYESALLQIIPAMEKTARRRRPRAGVGKRFKAFVNEEMPLVTGFSTGGNNQFGNFSVANPDKSGNNQDFLWVMYELVRNSIVHEGELDPRVTVNEEGKIKLGHNSWAFPHGFVLGFIVAVVAAPENRRERYNGNDMLNVGDESVSVKALMGRRWKVEEILRRASKRPDFKFLDINTA